MRADTVHGAKHVDGLLYRRFNAITYDFSDFRPTSLERSEQKVRLRIYKFYAWGVPLLISGVAATADYTRKNSLAEGTYLRPQFCQTEHWFAGKFWSKL